MWEAIQYVVSPLSLVAFVAAVIAMVLRTRIRHRVKLLQTLPEEERSKYLIKSLETYHIEHDNLSREQKYNLMLEVLRQRATRFRIMALTSIVIILILAIAVVTFLALDNNRSEAVQKTANLRVSELSEARIHPLDGHSIISYRKDGVPVYAGGFSVSIVLSHDKASDHSILIRALDLTVLKYENGPNKEFHYKINPNKVPPEGFAAPREFSVALTGNSVAEVNWTLDKSGKYYQAVGERNLFNTKPPIRLKLDSKNDDIEEIVGTVVAWRTGYYDVMFTIHYIVDGQERSINTKDISFYYE